MRKFTSIFLVLFLLVVIGCTEEPQSPESAFEPNIHLSDAKKRDLLTSRLDDEKIPYKIEHLDRDQNEYVVWSKEDDKMVKGIVREITKSNCGDSDLKSITMINNEQNKYLVSLLMQDSIPYNIVENNLKNDTSYAIEYNIADDEKVRALVVRALTEKPFYAKGT